MNAAEPYQAIVNQQNNRNRRNRLGNRPNIRVKPTEMSEYLANFTDIIDKKISNNHGKGLFDVLLRQHRALIAGGSVLAASLPPDHEINDFDIYVPIENALSFFKEFIEFLFTMYTDTAIIDYSDVASSLYCNSFLRRNGIKKVHRFTVKHPDIIRNSVSFDIMTVRKAKTPIDVVNNFDLTFCQIWYDGKSIWSSHPEDVRSKKGKLQGDYRKLFISGNTFIRKRVQKYIERGYSVGLDEFTADEIKDSMSFNTKICTNPIENSSIYAAWEEPEFVKGWAIRVLKKSFFNVPYLNTIAETLYVYNRSRKLYPDKKKIWDSDTLVQRLYPDSVIEADDGYDTDTFIENEARLVDLADRKYRDIPGFPELAPDLTPELKFHRMANIVIRDAIWPLDNPQQNFSRLYYGTVNPESGAITYSLHNLGFASTYYYVGLRDKGLRVATEDYLFASENDVVYDLHKHPMEGAINKENLEGYLQSHLGDPNKNAIPCYWHPEGGDSPRNCTQPLTLKDIFYCVDFDFFFKFKRGEQRVDPSLSLNIPKYDQILYNTKEGEPQDPSWPNLFHQGVCPFCLESVSREAGCLYMTHPNPLGLPQSSSPFCNPALVYKEMLDYYRKEGRRADPNYLPEFQDHIEFCIECGRPSYNHKHFTYDEPRQLIPGGASVCKGGSRVELYARVLEIRSSFRHGRSRQETASLANDVVEKVDKMEHAREAYAVAISQAEGADRVWGNGITFNEASNTKEHEGGRRRYTKTRKVKR